MFLFVTIRFAVIVLTRGVLVIIIIVLKIWEKGVIVLASFPNRVFVF